MSFTKQQVQQPQKIELFSDNQQEDNKTNKRPARYIQKEFDENQDDSGFQYKKYNNSKNDKRINHDNSRNFRRRAFVPVNQQLDDLQKVNQPKWMDTFNSSYSQPYMQHPNGSLMPYPSLVPYPWTPPQPEFQNEENQTRTTTAKSFNGNNQPLPPQQMYPPMYMYPQTPYGYMYPAFAAPTSSQEFMPHMNFGYSSDKVNPVSPEDDSDELEREKLSRRHKRKMRESILSQRGRRLSQLSRLGPDYGLRLDADDDLQLNNNEKILFSPHKDVPERDFYRHANVSIGKDLQLKQIFGWCLGRELDRLKLERNKSLLKNNKINSAQFAYDLFKDFINDIKSGKSKIDWQGSSYKKFTDSLEIDENGKEEKNPEDMNDNHLESMNSSLKAIFNEDLLKISKLKKHPTRSLDRLDTTKSDVKVTTSNKVGKVFIPNLKNQQNRENLRKLQERISMLKNEISVWDKSLKVNTKEIESYLNNDTVELSDQKKTRLLAKNLPDLNLSNDFIMRMDRFKETAHLVNSNLKTFAKNQKRQLSKLAINQQSTRTTDDSKGLSMKDILVRLYENSNT